MIFLVNVSSIQRSLKVMLYKYTSDASTKNRMKRQDSLFCIFFSSRMFPPILFLIAKYRGNRQLYFFPVRDGIEISAGASSMNVTPGLWRRVNKNLIECYEKSIQSMFNCIYKELDITISVL